MVAHVLCYFIFIVSLGMFAISFQIDDDTTLYSDMLMVVSLTSATSQLILIYIFNGICNQQRIFYVKDRIPNCRFKLAKDLPCRSLDQN
jgi:hypothetical protein